MYQPDRAHLLSSCQSESEHEFGSIRFFRHRHPIVRPQTVWGGMGTLEKIDSKISCANKGCYTDPFGLDGMYTTISAGVGHGAGSTSGLTTYLAMSQSARNENLHRLINRLIAFISRLSAQLLQKRIKLRV